MIKHVFPCMCVIFTCTFLYEHTNHPITEPMELDDEMNIHLFDETKILCIM